MGEHKIVIPLEERQLLAHAVFALTRCRAAPAERRDPLPQTQIEPFHKGRVDLLAAGRQDLLHRGLRAEDNAVLHRHEPPPSHGFHYLCIEQLGKRHPPRFGYRACGPSPRRRHPVPAMRHDGGEVMRVPIAQKERHTPGRQ